MNENVKGQLEPTGVQMSILRAGVRAFENEVARKAKHIKNPIDRNRMLRVALECIQLDEMLCDAMERIGITVVRRRK